jgi:hypothetical protein
MLVHGHSVVEVGLPSDEENAVEGAITTRKDRILQLWVITWGTWYQGIYHQLSLLGELFIDWLEDGHPARVRVS